MARRMRERVAGAAVHVWQRGNEQRTVFETDAEYRMFLGILLRQCGWYGVRLEGYCLMSNHYHLVLVGERTDSISMAVGRTNQEYSVFRHKAEGTQGHLWEKRYGSKILTGSHYWSALCYVERNPVEAGMVLAAWDWPWSSARVRLGMLTEDGVDLRRWRERYGEWSWRRVLETGVFEAALEERAVVGQF
jgi:putative transposase